MSTARKTRKKQSDAAQNRAQDFFTVGYRLLLSAATALLIYFSLTQVTTIPTPRTLMLAVGLSLVVNLILLAVTLIPQIATHSRWVAMPGDWLIVGAFAWLVHTDVILSLFLIAGLAFVSLVRLGLWPGMVNALVMASVFGGVVAYVGGLAEIQAFATAYAMPLLIVMFATVGGAIALKLHDRTVEQRTKNMRTEAQARMNLVRNMQERTIAITEMAQLLSATLNYRRVLDEALKVGRLAMQDNKTRSFVAIVFLYRSEDNRLHIVNARGLGKNDKIRSIPGQAGLVGETLRLCEPIFSGSVRKDPELGHFVSLRNARSVVAVPLRAGFDNFGVMVFASQTQFAFDDRYQAFLEAIGIQTTIALQNAALYQNLADEKERIIQVDQDARKKLARDLHDGPTQDISAIVLRLTVMQAEGPPDHIRAELEKLEDIARKTVSQLRSMMFTLRPVALESKGLDAALEQLAEKTDAIYDQKVEILVSPDAEDSLSDQQSETIFAIVNEAVNNARKHAQAELIRVRITRYQDEVIVEVIDNGAGFDVAAMEAAWVDRKDQSLGWKNLHEAAERVDGHLKVDSAPGQGTSIVVWVPLDPAGKNLKAQNNRKQKAQQRQNGNKKRDTVESFKLTPMR